MDELLGFSLGREIEFSIDFTSRNDLISKAPQQTAPTELKSWKSNYKNSLTKDSSFELHRRGASFFVRQEKWVFENVYWLYIDYRQLNQVTIRNK